MSLLKLIRMFPKNFIKNLAKAWATVDHDDLGKIVIRFEYKNKRNDNQEIWPNYKK